MSLTDLIDNLSKSDKVSVKKGHDLFAVNLNGDFLIIYPHIKLAEFLDLGDNWDDLYKALEEYYKEIPELKPLYEYLRREEYKINF
ncbi:Uncharacterised protein [uncultured archaeon]|nr:Uncharacterised protein [uncultured archaeon]